MPRRTRPHPSERHALEYREAAHRQAREDVGRYERAGFGNPEGFRGAYAERPHYAMPRGMLYRPEPEGSGWPSRLHHLSPESEERHLRAYRDRDLARSVDAAIFQALGPEADRIAVYANDAEITLTGRDVRPAAGRAAVDVARRVPGVHRVHDSIHWRRREGPSYRAHRA